MTRSGRDFSQDEGLGSPSLSDSRSPAETDLRSRSGSGTRESPYRDQTADSRTHHRAQEREPSHSPDQSDLKMLTDIGTFRALAFEDLARHGYGGDVAEARKRLATLTRQGLVRSRTRYPELAVYVTLTRAGHQLVSARGERGNPSQRFYHGFVRTRDARHDAALYRLYQQEIERIGHRGGRVRRVILDFELRQSITRQLAKLKSLPDRDQADIKQQIAQEHGLTVVKGKILLPDLRLEYEEPDQQLAKVDLELVTSHYRRHGLVAKSQAGFAMYAFAEDAARLRPAMEDPEIMQGILSL
jgi:hypothetical protein